MRLYKLIMIMTLSLLGLMLTGCSFSAMPFMLDKAKPVYISENQVAEIARPVKARVWINNAETKKKELRTVSAQAGWYIGRLSINRVDAE